MNSMKLLHLDSSILGSASVSRELTHALVDAYRRAFPDIQVTYRDLGANPLPHISPATKESEPSALSDELIAELEAADVLVIGAPLYNFTIPSALKSWIDRVVVAGKTFRYGAHGAEGLVPDKKTYVVVSRGGVYAGTPVEHMHEGYLKQVLNFLGVHDIEVIRAEGIGMGQRKEALAASLAIIDSLFPKARAA
ncbi:FMN-dependent NADH-azoreductase [Pendulispora albinea]|uniref:FMN dependent NADH:quinone oxidoreductase n=1 Tax=Pendulispora albinea TaxID=2741071 RepID=A0ABZ2LMW1_9BACT